MIWLIDRSRVVDGRGTCQRARLNNYHLGPHGYGIAMKATKIPLMTGIGGHEGLAPILEWCRDHDDEIVQALNTQGLVREGEIAIPVPFDIIRAGVKGAIEAYWKVVTARGFAYLNDDESVKDITREQCYLIEGLIWAWCIEVLPEILRRARIVEVEHDDVYVFGCTCGLGDGILGLGEHSARDCHGIGLMCKPDFLAVTRFTQELEYHEFKTTSLDSPVFRDKWEVQVQMFSATLDAERRHGKHVQSVYIHGLIKGRRQSAYNSETGKYDFGPPRQSSVFCYGYRKPGMPPMETEQWAALYEYTDGEGKNRKLPKAFQKAGVWELPDGWIPAGVSKGEFWTQWIPPEARRKNLIVLGPFSRQSLMVDHFLQETQGEEGRWQEGLWQLYDQGTQILHATYGPELPEGLDINAAWWEVVWPDPVYQGLLDRLFPRSYECRRYGMRNRCQFETLCFYHEGWADPIGSGKYIPRAPHHLPERAQLIDRGLLPPDEGLAEEIEQEL